VEYLTKNFQIALRLTLKSYTIQKSYWHFCYEKCFWITHLSRWYNI